jgi:hypothetical protein
LIPLSLSKYSTKRRDPDVNRSSTFRTTKFELQFYVVRTWTYSLGVLVRCRKCSDNKAGFERGAWASSIRQGQTNKKAMYRSNRIESKFICRSDFEENQEWAKSEEWN